MTDRDRSPMQGEFLRPHVKATNPHPQYVLKTDAAATGVALATATPAAETVGASGAAGTATTAARADHVHALPGLATQGKSGFLSAADKIVLDSANAGIAAAQNAASAAQATANNAVAALGPLSNRVTALENATPAASASLSALTALHNDLERRFRVLLLAYTNAGMPFPPALAPDLVAAANQG